MKKVLFLFAFLFTVVCFAAPPPDMPSGFLTEDLGIFRSQGDIAVQTFEVQEVAHVYKVDIEMVSYQVLLMEQEGKLEFSKLVMINSCYNYLEEINRPPDNNILTGSFLDKQHYNCGCLLTFN